MRIWCIYRHKYSIFWGRTNTQRRHAFTRKTGSLFGLRLNLQHDVSSRVWHMFIVPKKNEETEASRRLFMATLSANVPPGPVYGPQLAINYEN